MKMVISILAVVVAFGAACTKAEPMCAPKTYVAADGRSYDSATCHMRLKCPGKDDQPLPTTFEGAWDRYGKSCRTKFDETTKDLQDKVSIPSGCSLAFTAAVNCEDADGGGQGATSGGQGTTSGGQGATSGGDFPDTPRQRQGGAGGAGGSDGDDSDSEGEGGSGGAGGGAYGQA